MADRGVMIKDVLSDWFKYFTFLEKRKQLPPQEIEVRRKIASICIHIERTIGRIKNIHSHKHDSSYKSCLCIFEPALVTSTKE